MDENGNGTADRGEQIVYSFTVTNTGNVTLRGIVVTDAMLRGLPPDPIAILLRGQEYTVTAGDVDGQDIVNVAPADGEAPGGGTVSSDEASTATPTSQPVMVDGDDEAGLDRLLPDTGSPMWWGSLLIALSAIAAGAALTRVRQSSQNRLV